MTIGAVTEMETSTPLTERPMDNVRYSDATTMATRIPTAAQSVTRGIARPSTTIATLTTATM